ncbi:MAG: type II toxin-antitoxin system VapC family toxin [Anaerolineaceae bacterium]|nr:type II toxin-antitoxin system VapC family toxin [Anaerolineaceae bacterium]
MNILLDTHIAVWAIVDDPRLSNKARDLLLDPANTIYYSSVSTLEINNKTKSKKNNLEFSTQEFVENCEAAGFIELPLFSRHFTSESSLKWGGDGKEHKDPYDRLLLAQALEENYCFMTHDEMIRCFDENCIIAV